MGAAWQSSPTLCYFFTRTFAADLNSVAAVIQRKPAVIPPVFYIARNLSANPLGLLSSSRQTRWSRTTGNVQKKKKKLAPSTASARLRDPTRGVPEMKTIQQIQIFYDCGCVKEPLRHPEKQQRIKPTCALLITHIRNRLQLSAAAKAPLLLMNYGYLLKVCKFLSQPACWLTLTCAS